MTAFFVLFDFHKNSFNIQSIINGKKEINTENKNIANTIKRIPKI